jgi:hypothetical protein
MSLWFHRERKRIRSGRRGNAQGRQVDGFSPASHQMKISLFRPDASQVPFNLSTVQSKPLPTIDAKPLPTPPSITSWSAADDTSAIIQVRNPPYTRAMLDLASPTTPPSAFSLKTSPISAARPPSIPIPVFTPKSAVSALDDAAMNDSIHGSLPIITRNGRAAATPSLSTDDIENILDMATMYSAPDIQGTRRSNVLRTMSPDPMPSWTVSRDTHHVPHSPGPVAESINRPNLVVIAPTHSPTTGLLTPMTASTQREPPRAQLPSSPVPSTMSTGFPRPSIDEYGIQRASVGNWESIAPRP